jgi:hypothetical protein
MLWRDYKRGFCLFAWSTSGLGLKIEGLSNKSNLGLTVLIILRPGAGYSVLISDLNPVLD